MTPSPSPVVKSSSPIPKPPSSAQPSSPIPKPPSSAQPSSPMPIPPSSAPSSTSPPVQMLVPLLCNTMCAFSCNPQAAYEDLSDATKQFMDTLCPLPMSADNQWALADLEGKPAIRCPSTACYNMATHECTAKTGESCFECPANYSMFTFSYDGQEYDRCCEGDVSSGYCKPYGNKPRVSDEAAVSGNNPYIIVPPIVPGTGEPMKNPCVELCTDTMMGKTSYQFNQLLDRLRETSCNYGQRWLDCNRE